MRFKTGLRNRLILVFIGFSLLLGSLIVIGVIVSTQISETRSKKKTIRMEAEYYLRSHMSTFAAPTSNSFFMPKLSSPFINVYYGEELLPGWARDELPKLPQGEYFRSNDKQRYHIIIKNLPDGERFYMLYNVTRLDASRESLSSLRVTILGVIMPIMVFGFVLGLVTAHKVINPVVSLADYIKEKGVDSPLPDDFVKEYSDDEIGFLAATLKNTLDDLHASVAREAAFARDASHELRTPVSTIKGALELLSNTPVMDDEWNVRILGRIQRATVKMEHLIKSFLWLSRYETIGEFDFPESDTFTVVNETVLEHMYLIKDKPVKVEIEEEFKQKLPVAPQVMNILISNLLRNAFTYTQAGKVTILIREQCLQVKDTGTGINSYQLMLLRKNSGKHHAEGFGFGIAIVRRLCFSLGWTFLIESEPEKGTIVTLCYNQKSDCGCLSKKSAEDSSGTVNGGAV
jgi:signal transduction histidine kinase